MKHLLRPTLYFCFASLSFLPVKTVYICDNGTTKVYHNRENCPRLEKCSFKVIKMSEAKAIDKGLRACRDKND